MSIDIIKEDRFYILYELNVHSEKEAMEIAKDICYEQTVEFPAELITSNYINENIVGKIENIDKKASGYDVQISFSIESSAFELTQFLNIIYGNISLKHNIKVKDIILPETFAKKFNGPRFGIKGIREAVGINNRPLLATALKPMGLSSKELSKLCYKFALGGIDIIKDDHGITNQSYSAYHERVNLCTEAVHNANEQTGFKCIYVPNVTAPYKEMLERAGLAKDCGAGGLLISPGITGFDMVRVLSCDDEINIPLICHPAFLGSYVLNKSGLSHKALFGQIIRISGGDAIIYPNFGGRFSFSKDECMDIVDGCKKSMYNIKSIFPVPAGGMSMDFISELLNFYGPDVIFLMGGGLIKHGPDIVENSRYFRKIVGSIK